MSIYIQLMLEGNKNQQKEFVLHFQRIKQLEGEDVFF